MAISGFLSNIRKHCPESGRRDMTKFSFCAVVIAAAVLGKASAHVQDGAPMQHESHLGSIHLSTTTGKDTFRIEFLTDADDADQAIVRTQYWTREHGAKEEVLREQVCFASIHKNVAVGCDVLHVGEDRVKAITISLLERIDEQTFAFGGAPRQH
jgi:hypothetical protein